MPSTHIMFFSFPHPPEVNPTLPIVATLVRRGYRVSYVTSDQFRSRLMATGADFVRCPAFDPSSIFKATSSGSQYEGSSAISDLATRTVREVGPFFVKNRPDLIIYDNLAIAARMLANNLSTPCATTTPMFVLDPKLVETQIPDPEYRSEEMRLSLATDQFLQRNGVASDGFKFHQEKLNILLFPRALQIPGDVFGRQYFYAGRCAAEQPYHGNWIRKASGRLSVLISNSTTYSSGPEFFRMCIESLSGLGWHVVLSIGNIDPLALGRPPEQFEIVSGISHVQILPHMSLFICPGGIVTQAEAMYHGVPLVAISNGFRELEWVSENIPRLGIGIHLKGKHLTSDELRQAATRVLEDLEIRGNVDRLKKLVRREAGGEETANRIEEYLELGV